MASMSISVSFTPVSNYSDVDSDLIIFSSGAQHCLSLPGDQVQCAQSLHQAVQQGHLTAVPLPASGQPIVAAGSPASQSVPLPLVHAAIADVCHTAGPNAGPTVPVAYSFRLPCAYYGSLPSGGTQDEGGGGTYVTLLSWELQCRSVEGAAGSALEDWRTVDRRELDRQTAEAHSEAWKEGCSVVAYLPPSAAYCHTGPTQYRLVIRDVVGCAGGSMSRHYPVPVPVPVPAPSTQGTSPPANESDKQNRTVVVEDWTLYTQSQDQAAGGPQQVLPPWGWELRLCGPAGQQRLRFRSHDGRCDVRTVDPVFFAPSEEYKLELNLQLSSVAGMDTAGCALMECRVCVNGHPLPMQLVHTDTGRDAGTLATVVPAARDEERPDIRYTSSIVPVCLWPYSPPLLAESCRPGLLCFDSQGRPDYPSISVGRPVNMWAAISVEKADTGATQLTAAGKNRQTWADVRSANCEAVACKPEPWDADCPLGGDAKVLRMCARMKKLSVTAGGPAEEGRGQAQVQGEAVASAAGSAQLHREHCVPFRSIEHVLQWTPVHSAHHASPLPLPLPEDDGLRCRVPLSRRGPAGPSSGPALPATAVGCDRGSITGHAGPLVMACHDCGAAVYKEDGAVQGMQAGRSRRVGTGGKELGSRWHGLPESVPWAGADRNTSEVSSGCTVSEWPALVLPKDARTTRAHSACSVDVGHCYTFEHWSSIDVFVYFSHDRVAIPPPGWIAAAHRNGVRILATLIFEWRDGERGLEMMLDPYLQGMAAAASTPAQPVLARQLARIAAYYGFDGYLVNVEAHASALAAGGMAARTACPAETEERYVHATMRGAHPSCAALLAFLSDLTREVHAACPSDEGLVIWYDSIDVHSGRVAWRNGLDDCNKPFMEACDGLFVNYHYNDDNLCRTAKAAAGAGHASALTIDSSPPFVHSQSVPPVSRSRDVFIGCDVWGRGTYGGGQWDTHTAAQAIAEASAREGTRLSFAVFGPAWTYEACGGSASLVEQRRLDAKLWIGGQTETGKKGGTQWNESSLGGLPQPSVINPDGLLLTASQQQALGSGPAIAAAPTGWSTVVNGGQGWTVQEEDGKEWAQRQGAASVQQPYTPITCFVSSHGWCMASQTVLWPPELCAADTGGASPSATWPFSIRVSEWYRGTGPKYDDLYRLSACLIDAGGQPVPLVSAPAPSSHESSGSTGASEQAQTELSTGDLVCAVRWQCATLVFPTVPCTAVGVRVTHAGKDVEYWAGHFGARMRGMKVTLVPLAAGPKDVAVISTDTCGSAYLHVSGGLTTCPGVRTDTGQEGQGGAHAQGSRHLWDIVRPAITALPFTTTFNTGVGCGVWQDGRVVYRGAWTRHGAIQALPSYIGHLATVGLCEQAQVDYAHDAAWNGGTAMHVRFPCGEALRGLTMMVRLFAARVVHGHAGEEVLRARLVFAVPSLDPAQVHAVVKVQPVLVTVPTGAVASVESVVQPIVCMPSACSATPREGTSIHAHPVLWHDSIYHFTLGDVVAVGASQGGGKRRETTAGTDNRAVPSGQARAAVREIRIALTVLSPVEMESLDLLIGSLSLAEAS